MYLQYGDNIRAYNDYHEAKEEAKKQGLLLAEYGNMYGSNMVYAYWNETGNRNDDEKIIAYYKFNDNDDPEPISEKRIQRLYLSLRKGVIKYVQFSKQPKRKQ